jgi:hypothetical protein
MALLTPAKGAEIVRLMTTTNLSLRQIARETGVSRGTIDNAKRDPSAFAAKHSCGDRRGLSGELPERTGDVGTCPTCGTRHVELPCLACLLRANPLPRVLDGVLEDGSLRLDLHGETRLRYERVRARKERVERREARDEEIETSPLAPRPSPLPP